MPRQPNILFMDSMLFLRLQGEIGQYHIYQNRFKMSCDGFSLRSID